MSSVNNIIGSLRSLVEARGGKVDEARLKEQESIIKSIDENIDQGSQLILEAPTGFGKTECVFVSFLRAYRRSLIDRIIHVVPTRSLLRALFRRYLTYMMNVSDDIKILVSYDHGDLWFRRPGVWNEIIKKGVTFDNIKNYRKEILKTISKAINEYRYEELRRLLGHSYFLFNVTVSTLDVFAYAFLSKRTYQDYMLMPINLMSYSLIVLDEVHILQDIDYYTFDVIKRIIRDFANAGIPIVLMSATLPSCIINELKSTMALNHLVVKWKGGPIDVEISPLMRGKTLTIDKLRVILENGDKDTLIVVNTIRRAQEIYEHLKPLEKKGNYIVRLIHGMFCDHDRFIREIELEDLAKLKRKGEKNKTLILVSTQVSECGLDYPFDMVLSELAPMDALIQRIGRIRDKGVAIIYDVEHPQPYEKDILKLTKDTILNNVSLLEKAPRDVNNARTLLDKVYSTNIVNRLRERSLYRHEYLYKSFYDYFEVLNVLRNPELEIRIRPNTYIEALIVSDNCYEEILKTVKVKGSITLCEDNECYHEIRTKINDGYIIKIQLSKRYFTFDEALKRFKPEGLVGNVLRAYGPNALELRLRGKCIEVVPTEIFHPYNLYLLRESIYSSEVGLRR